MGSISRNEEREQARLMRWASLRAVRELAPALRYLFHVPNGGKRDAFTGAQLVALGVKRGVPDLLFPYQRGDYVGLVIEMKSDAGRLTAHQSDWFDYLTSQRWQCVICRSAIEARAALASYLGQPALLEVPL